ncbi:MAG: archease [Actinobacteria bacterium]|nr:archease [Actinomycetota bacterium]MDI6830747.1 archease [Actinomycetota bacterium]
MRPFELVEHTSDVGIRARGGSLGEAFGNCALGMMSLMLDPGKVRHERRVRIEAEAEDPEALLVAWLSEILFRVEAEGFAFARFEDVEPGEGKVAGWGWGEPLDPERHDLRIEVKAPTYHGLELREENGVWVAQVIFDV